MKAKKLSKLARKLDRLSAKVEDLDLAMSKDKVAFYAARKKLRVASLSLEDAAFYVDEMAARK